MLGTSVKTDVNTTKMTVWDIGKRNVFEAVDSGGVGDRLFMINLVQTQNEHVMCSMVGFVTVIGNKGCDDLRSRFCIEMFGVCFIVRIGCAQSSICVGEIRRMLKPFFVMVFDKMELKPMCV